MTEAKKQLADLPWITDRLPTRAGYGAGADHPLTIRYEFEVFDKCDQTVANGEAPTLLNSTHHPQNPVQHCTG
jgi:hypothetical protein